jgi:hypothetical protein
MSTKLNFAKDLALPREAVTQTFAILAKRGMGKTYTASVETEELIKAGEQVVIADPVGVWWGLRSSADGKREGLPVIVLGGDHADLPLVPTAGEVVADLVVKQRASVLLDMSHMSGGEMTRFMADFAERVYRLKGHAEYRTPLHLILDEADAFAPQRPMPGETVMLGAIDKIVRRGRARGLGVTLITQRTAALNKNVLTQCEVLILHRLIAPQDRAAVKAWVEIHGTAKQQKALFDSLASLQVGEAWIWSPGWLDLFQRVHIRRRETFDSSSTPKAGSAPAAPQKFADVDIGKLKDHLEGALKDQEANDPKLLKKRINELEHQLKAVPEAAPAPVPERIEVSVLKDEDITELQKAVQIAGGAITDLCNHINKINDTIKAAGSASSQQVHVITQTEYKAVPEYRTQRSHGSVYRADSPPPAPAATRHGGDSTLSGGERKILTALAQYPGGRTKTQVAILTSYSHNGGGFNNYISSLRSRGLLVGGSDRLQITPEGLKQLGSYVPLPKGRELVDHWANQLGKAERSILLELVATYPNPLTKSDLGSRTGYEPSGGGFNNALSKLRTLELIHGRNDLRAAGAFFE